MAEIIIRRDSGTYAATRVIWAVLWIVDVILSLRFILRLIAANPGAGFTRFIYNVSAPLLSPFANVVRSARLDNGGMFEWSTLIAMIVYWLIAWAIVRLIWFMGAGSTGYIERDRVERV
jgi:uncharacterized protein YggT (Ycf19 family)